jgi:hypothetical protein
MGFGGELANGNVVGMESTAATPANGMATMAMEKRSGTMHGNGKANLMDNAIPCFFCGRFTKLNSWASFFGVGQLVER